MSNLEFFIRRYRGRELLIDTNLLILLIAGQTDKACIYKLKTTRAYDEHDYVLLKKVIKDFRLITTAHVLAETSNLCEKLEAGYKRALFSVFSEIVQRIVETPVLSRALVRNPLFQKLGLTDTAVSELAQQGTVVLTDDFELHSYLTSADAVAANMNLFRGERYFKN